MPVKLVTHGSTLAVPLPVEFVNRLKLKQGQYITITDERYWLKFRPISRALQTFNAAPPPDFDPDIDGSYSDYRAAQEIAALETPSTIGFFSQKRK